MFNLGRSTSNPVSGMHGRSQRMLLGVLVALLGLSGLVAGCGGSSSGSSTAQSSSGEQSSSGGSAEATKKLEAALKPITPSIPSEPLDMSKNSGKAIWFIAPTLQIPFVQEIADGVKEAASVAGLKATVFDGKGQADLFNQGITSAVNQHADGIILQAIDPKLVSGALEQAKAAGIPVVDVVNRGPEKKPPSDVDGQVTVDYAESGRLLGDYIAAHGDGNSQVAVITESIFEVYQEMVPAFEEELSKQCPGCEVVSTQSVEAGAAGPELTNITSTLKQRYPDLDYIFAVSDALAINIIPALEAAGGETKVVSADGVESNLEIVREGGLEVADVSDPPLDSMGWAIVDQLGRLMAGQSVAEESTDQPIQLFTEENIPAAGEQLFPKYAGFQAKYEKVWGLK